MADTGRTPSSLPADDLVLPFRTVRSDVIGRVVRLGSTIDTVLSGHSYPEPVSYALGEALVLTAMLGSALKTQGKFILQTKTDGALDFLVADYVSPGNVRGYANYDKKDAVLAKAQGRGDQGALLGTGHVAMTIDPTGDKNTYQGIVAIEREPLVEVAHTYFRQSEQLPTFIRLAVARHYGSAGRDLAPVWRWRAGGLLIQKLPRAGGKLSPLSDEARDASLEGEDDEDWNRTRHLAATVEDHEMLDPTLSPERLLYRLFHEEGVRVTPSTPVAAACRCSRARIKLFLERFGPDELADMREADGAITVTCEFCSRKYRFAAGEIG
ncbi:MAG TPA: Hsp33 family molecular chaperone [Hyphomicrobiaceae bacterium]|jgi:molecular chaperone Hsp33|nr:Hsp33 family molecular chaperone [Hyphomicrobiaceae bacterium]